MSTVVIPALLGCVLFGVGLLYAAATDLRHRRIGNRLVVVLAVAWAPLALAAGIPADQMATSLLAAALVLSGGFGCFAMGWLGGGDAKLAAVVVLWLGAGQAVAFLLLTAILGAGLAWPLLLLWRNHPPEPSGSIAPVAKREIPYGPAMALAGIALLQGSPWMAVL